MDNTSWQLRGWLVVGLVLGCFSASLATARGAGVSSQAAEPAQGSSGVASLFTVNVSGDRSGFATDTSAAVWREGLLVPVVEIDTVSNVGLLILAVILAFAGMSLLRR